MWTKDNLSLWIVRNPASQAMRYPPHAVSVNNCPRLKFLSQRSQKRNGKPSISRKGPMGVDQHINMRKAEIGVTLYNVESDSAANFT